MGDKASVIQHVIGKSNLTQFLLQLGETVTFKTKKSRNGTEILSPTDHIINDQYIQCQGHCYGGGKSFKKTSNFLGMALTVGQELAN